MARGSNQDQQAQPSAPRRGKVYRAVQDAAPVDVLWPSLTEEGASAPKIDIVEVRPEPAEEQPTAKTSSTDAAGSRHPGPAEAFWP